MCDFECLVTTGRFAPQSAGVVVVVVVPVVFAVVVIDMPNGHRAPYRLGNRDPPSPAHSLDSDDTFEVKLPWRWHARWVLDSWLVLVYRRRAARGLSRLAMGTVRHYRRLSGEPGSASAQRDTTDVAPVTDREHPLVIRY